MKENCSHADLQTDSTQKNKHTQNHNTFSINIKQKGQTSSKANESHVIHAPSQKTPIAGHTERAPFQKKGALIKPG